MFRSFLTSTTVTFLLELYNWARSNLWCSRCSPPALLGGFELSCRGARQRGLAWVLPDATGDVCIADMSCCRHVFCRTCSERQEILSCYRDCQPSGGVNNWFSWLSRGGRWTASQKQFMTWNIGRVICSTCWMVCSWKWPVATLLATWNFVSLTWKRKHILSQNRLKEWSSLWGIDVSRNNEWRAMWKKKQTKTKNNKQQKHF